jgi:hypothetical protein
MLSGLIMLQGWAEARKEDDMRRFILIHLLVSGIILAAAMAPPLEAQKGAGQKNYFMKLTSPQDTQYFWPGTTWTVRGLLQLPSPAPDVRTLWLRVRAFRPGQKEFVIANEFVIQLEKALLEKVQIGRLRYTFEAPFKLPKEQGEYLLRVDCLDFKVHKYPQSLVATQSVFIHVNSALKPKDATGNSDPISMNTPTAGSTYSTTATIFAAGSTSDAIMVRLRFLKDSTIYQENIMTPNPGGSWSGSLAPPTGGWPTGGATIEAQGLDKNGTPIPGDRATVNITISGP